MTKKIPSSFNFLNEKSKQNFKIACAKLQSTQYTIIALLIEEFNRKMEGTAEEKKEMYNKYFNAKI